MTRKTLLTLAVLTAFSAGSVAAFAQADAPARFAARFEHMDVNKDGYVDRAKVRSQPEPARRAR